MPDLSHLFYVGQSVRYLCDGKWYKCKVKEVYADHIIVDCPDISDHIWFARDYNLDCLYPDYNFDE